MKTYLRLIYRSIGFIILFFLIGTLLVYIETILIENNVKSFIDESGILQNDYEKSYIPIIASLIISYLIVFQIPWFKKKEEYS
tara:strand:- start:3740 stop:3988 length:249 start_codon:yes stop_codon:yes gene_type:complete